MQVDRTIRQTSTCDRQSVNQRIERNQRRWQSYQTPLMIVSVIPRNGGMVWNRAAIVSTPAAGTP